MKGFVRPNNPKISALVTLNNKNIGDITLKYKVDNPSVFSFTVNGSDFIKNELNQLQLDIVGAARPKDLSDSRDSRLLGFKIKSMTMKSSLNTR